MDKSNDDLLKENALLKEELQQQIEMIKRRDKRIEKLLNEIKELRMQGSNLSTEVERLGKELRKYINENTPSGSIPPYLKKKLEEEVDQYAKVPEDTDVPHKENKRNARPKHIDRKEHHSPKNPYCPCCGGKGRRRGTSTRKRIVVHMQLPKFENVEHESDIYQCTNCGKVFGAPIPDVLPNSEFDLTTIVLISYLCTASNMSVGGVVELFRSFGLELSEGSITNSLKRLKKYLGPYHRELLEKVKAASARCKDETTHRFNGQNFWTWVIATKNWVYYTIERRRSHKVAQKLASDHGTDTVDGYAGYNGLSDIQRDWSHSLRRAKKPIYDFGEDESYDRYKSFIKNLALLFHDAKIAKKERGVSKKLREKYDQKLWELLKSAPTKGRNFSRIVNYIMKFDGEWFTFLQYKDVEPTSNRAERALRHLVIKRKISQQSRGQDNMDSYAMQVSLYMTSKVQGQDYMENLSNIIKSEALSIPYKS